MEGRERYPKLMRELEDLLAKAPKLEVATPEMVENLKQLRQELTPLRMRRITVPSVANDRTQPILDALAKDPDFQAAQRALANRMRERIDRTQRLLMLGYLPEPEVIKAARRAEAVKNMPDEWCLQDEPMTLDAAMADPAAFVEGMTETRFTPWQRRAVEALAAPMPGASRMVLTTTNPTSPSPSPSTFFRRMCKAMGNLFGFRAGKAAALEIVAEEVRRAHQAGSKAHMRAMTADRTLRPATTEFQQHPSDLMLYTVDEWPQPGGAQIIDPVGGQVLAELPSVSVSFAPARWQVQVVRGPQLGRNRAERRAARRGK